MYGRIWEEEEKREEVEGGRLGGNEECCNYGWRFCIGEVVVK